MSPMTKNDEQNDEVLHLYTVKNDEDDEGGGREGMSDIYVEQLLNCSVIELT